jgi:hypothetical protein
MRRLPGGLTGAIGRDTGSRIIETTGTSGRTALLR